MRFFLSNYFLDKSTLAIVVLIKLWKKRAIDARITRREPTRKLILCFDKQLMQESPFAIYIDVLENALELLKVCKQKYAANFGENHIKTKGIGKHIKKLQQQVDPHHEKSMGSNTSLGPYFGTFALKGSLMSLVSKSNLRKVQPYDEDSQDHIIVDMTKVIRSAELPPLRGSFSRPGASSIDVLVEVNEPLPSLIEAPEEEEM